MTAQTHEPAGSLQPLTGGALWGAALILALANFIAVLDMTIANVSVPNIAGSLGTTTNQGTWVITSYAVAEAITVPLTGWLAARFGAVRVFATAMMLFGLFSMLCGFMGSLETLVGARVLQGLVGGPLMPLSQALLLRIFPPHKAPAALGIWAVTTLTAPVLGPILGGYICDEYSWPWIFLINVPIAALFSILAWRILKRYENHLVKTPIDKVGLVLLIVWVGSLQIMLDEGKSLDWFSSPFIVGLAVTASVGFLAFLIWELHAKHPVVDLKIFRHRSYSICLVTISIGFAAFFALNVLTPLWLQSYMGYTSIAAGQVAAWTGLFGVFLAPVVARLASVVDLRKLISLGLIILGSVTLFRTHVNTDITYWQLSIPLMLTGIGLPLFFIPLMSLAMSSVLRQETASAAGLLSFVRTLSGAVATAILTTSWQDQSTEQHAELITTSDNYNVLQRILEAGGMTPEAALLQTDAILQNQAVMLATNNIMTFIGCSFLVAACVIWVAKRPKEIVMPGGGGH